MEICRLDPLVYELAFRGFHSRLSDRCAAKAAANGCIFGARAGGEWAGYLCTAEEEDGLRITYALTRPEYRRKGVFSALVRHAVQTAGNIVSIRVSAALPDYPAVRRCCEKLGFTRQEDLTIYTCTRENEAVWRAYLKNRGEKLCGTIRRQGYQAVSFREMAPEILDQLRYSDRSEYGNRMFRPAMYLDHPDSRLSWEMSYAAIRNGRLASYCLVTEEDAETAQIAQTSASAQDQGYGVILLPFVHAVQRIDEIGISRVFYAVYGENRQANAFCGNVLAGMTLRERTLENYCHEAYGEI